MDKSTTLERALFYFVKHKEAHGKATNTTKATYICILEDFIKSIKADTVSDLDILMIDNFIDTLSLKNYKPKTIKNKIVVIRSFIKFLYSKNLIDIRPEAIEIPRTVEVEANFLDEEEQCILIKSARNLRDKALIMTILSSGLRASEILNLKEDDLYRRSLIVSRGKGGKPRVTFIDPLTEKSIREYHHKREADSVFVFTNSFGKPLSRQYLSRMISETALRAGIKKRVSAHTLRHSFATNMLRKGARIEDVQPLMGHSNISTTRLYMHFTNEYLRERYDMFNKDIDKTLAVC
jgi:probable tyrosine recombinase xerC-like|nr:MAG TPA: SITE SPECIFIC RECOMBINASE XERD [Caudoviricetes sp.]